MWLTQGLHKLRAGAVGGDGSGCIRASAFTVVATTACPDGNVSMPGSSCAVGSVR